ncbi:SecY-interacting protein [Amphritea japonica]|uniref:SecY interacting protein Syd n=1 Tax=Amphritea japonica ATCC BAA-1530 TaxID=1278309 RepID=A0A7R6SSR7_9GAMM|nr:SecY-interacting protein [Amphritea japonica]BBB26530.1 SecY interacting protein Syd [Amphritea japonica ATCC BAA-1530]
MSKNLIDRIDSFISQALKLQLDQQGRLPLTIYDAEWPSECYQSTAEEGQQVPWKPILQSQESNLCHDMFQRLELALEYTIHEDIKTWFSQYWADPIPATSQWGDLSLIFIWNEKDCERLRGNLLGHLMTKQKQKQPASLFFACTEPDGEKFLTIDNETGEVWLEQPGKKPIMKLASSLEQFLNELTPKPIPDLEQ